MSLPREDFTPAAQGPLQALRVLDLSRLVCGNMLTLQLADMGADVIKVEDPGKGDPLRDWRTEGVSIHWKIYGRNKRSLALDLRQEKGRDVLRRLVPTADVLVESFKPGTLEKLGLAPDRLLEINPRLVVVRVSGFGQTGAYRDRPGFGTLIEGMSGLAAKTGFADREPVLPPLSLADMVAGLQGAFATMVALQSRTASGGGQVIDLSLLEPLLSILGADPANYRIDGRLPKRTGSRSQLASPRNVYKSADGRWLCISASMQSMTERLLRAIGRPELIEDPRFRTNTDRVRNGVELDAIIQDWIGQRTLAENLAAFNAAGVTVGPVYEVDQLLEDEHLRTRGSLVTVPDDELGEVVTHDVIPRLSRTPGVLRFAARPVGADSRAVLEAGGFDQASMDDLVAAGVVQVGEGR